MEHLRRELHHGAHSQRFRNMVAEKAIPSLGFTLRSFAPSPPLFVELDPLPDQFFKRQYVERIMNPLPLASERVSMLLFLLSRVLPLA